MGCAVGWGTGFPKAVSGNTAERRKEGCVCAKITVVCAKRIVKSIRLGIKEYQNMVLQGNDFCFDIRSMIEGRRVFRNGIPIGIVIGTDILVNKELVFCDGEWKVRMSNG